MDIQKEKKAFMEANRSFMDIGLGDVHIFLNDYEEHVLENQRLSALDIAPKFTPIRWWNEHKKNIGGWQEF